MGIYAYIGIICNKGMNAYMGMSAYTFMPICAFNIGISFMPIGIFPI